MRWLMSHTWPSVRKGVGVRCVRGVSFVREGGVDGHDATHGEGTIPSAHASQKRTWGYNTNMTFRMRGMVLFWRQENMNTSLLSASAVGASLGAAEQRHPASRRIHTPPKTADPQTLKLNPQNRSPPLTLMERSSLLLTISSRFGWKMTHDTLFVCPVMVCTSHAFVSFMRHSFTCRTQTRQTDRWTRVGRRPAKRRGHAYHTAVIHKTFERSLMENERESSTPDVSIRPAAGGDSQSTIQTHGRCGPTPGQKFKRSTVPSAPRYFRPTVPITAVAKHTHRFESSPHNRPSVYFLQKRRLSFPTRDTRCNISRSFDPCGRPSKKKKTSSHSQ